MTHAAVGSLRAAVRSFGARAFRRTLEEAQVADYQALYMSRKADGFGVAIELRCRRHRALRRKVFAIQVNRPIFRRLTCDSNR